MGDVPGHADADGAGAQLNGEYEVVLVLLVTRDPVVVVAVCTVWLVVVSIELNTGSAIDGYPAYSRRPLSIPGL